jgi:hypothetical protein
MRSLIALLPLTCALFAQTGPAGHWEGNIQTPDREVQITLDLAKDDKGAWTGSFADVSRNATGLPIEAVKTDGKKLTFRLALGANAPDFDCTLESAAAMNCTVNGPGGSVSGSLKRTGEAKIEKPKANPAVSKELEGNWEGSLDTPNGTLRIAVHFKNQPDNTVQATLDSLDQNSMGLPLNDVTQKDFTVEFFLRIAGGSYKGTLNKEGTQMVGDWTQGGGSLPLTLKKAAAK